MTYTPETQGVPTYDGVMTFVNHNVVPESDVVVNGLKKLTIRFSFEVETDGWISPPSDVALASDPAFQAFVDHLKILNPGSDLDFEALYAYRNQNTNSQCEPTV